MYLVTALVSLVSVSQAAVSGYETTFEGKDCTMYKAETDEVALNLKRTGRTYKTIVTTSKCLSAEVHITHNVDDFVGCGCGKN